MADSGITKKALVSALKAQLEEEPFEKITVGEICDRCDMNRKSFYYHFKDKFDLLDWIYTTEFAAAIKDKSYTDIGGFLKEVCEMLWANRKFYRQAFQISGQNSLCDCMTGTFYPYIKALLKEMKVSEQDFEFCIEFMTDALVCSVKKWILSRTALPPEDFAEKLKCSILLISNQNE